MLNACNNRDSHLRLNDHFNLFHSYCTSFFMGWLFERPLALIQDLVLISLVKKRILGLRFLECKVKLKGTKIKTITETVC